MKKFIVLFVSALLISFSTKAEDEPTYLEEMEGFSIIAGQGLACQASKYDTFELLARAYLISKASSNAEQAEGVREYNRAKVRTYTAKQMSGFDECGSIRRDFDNQLIFKSVLYGDGTIKTPDGKIITPRQPYDATLIYTKDPHIYDEIKEMSIKADKKAQERINRAKSLSKDQKTQNTRAISRNYGN